MAMLLAESLGSGGHSPVEREQCRSANIDHAVGDEMGNAPGRNFRGRQIATRSQVYLIRRRTSRSLV
jgi:hypothetical protein